MSLTLFDNNGLRWMVSRRGWPVWVWLAAALTVAFTDWFEGRAVAGLGLTCFLPGWAWLEAWSPRPTQLVWRVATAAGLSIVLVSLGSLYLIYLGIPLTKWHMLGVCALITLPDVLVGLWRHQPALEWPDRRDGLVLLLILLVAASLRLPRLGYAEFHEDEVEVTSLAARVINGESYAVFLHRKGPLQMLVPMAGWLLAGRITEAWARLPFAVASLLGVLLAAQLAGRRAGKAAMLACGLVLALNGYLVAFGRMVQYQALVFLLVSVGIACLWRWLQEGDARLSWPGLLCVGASLLAHYDALLYLPVVAYLGWRIWRRWPEARRALLVSGFVAGGTCLSFYVPYLLDPQFQHTGAYLADSRVGGAGLYNNLGLVWKLDAIYASRFYQPVLVALVAAAFIWYRPKPRAWQVVMGMGALGLAVGLWRPDWLRVGSLSLACLPWLMLVAAVAIGFYSRRTSGAQHPSSDGQATPPTDDQLVSLLWWAGPALAYVFLVLDPRTHIYVMYPGAALLAGLGAAVFWQKLGRLRPSLVVLAGAAVTLVWVYQALIFLPSETQFAALRSTWASSWGQTLYGKLPKPESYFGYPSRAGWKAAGWLMATRQVPDDYRSMNTQYSVATWYSFETPRSCFEDPLLYLIGQPGNSVVDYRQYPAAAQYTELGTVYSEGAARIVLIGKMNTPLRSNRLELDEIEPAFDALATPDRFGRLDNPAVTVDAQVGELARLIGFTVYAPEQRTRELRVARGETLGLRLHWRSLAPTGVTYRAFVHLGDDPVLAQWDDDLACRLPTLWWRPGQLAAGQFRISVPPQTPVGRYPLLAGVYDAATMERLPIWDESGQLLGDHIQLANVEVVDR